MFKSLNTSVHFAITDTVVETGKKTPAIVSVICEETLPAHIIDNRKLPVIIGGTTFRTKDGKMGHSFILHEREKRSSMELFYRFIEDLCTCAMRNARTFGDAQGLGIEFHYNVVDSVIETRTIRKSKTSGAAKRRARRLAAKAATK